MLKPALLTIAAAMLIPLGDGVAKYAYEVLGAPVPLMAWTRFAAAAVLVIPFVLYRGSVSLKDLTRPAVLFRGCLIATTISLILQAAARAPLADVFGGFFIAPAVSFLLAVVLLKERPGWTQTALIGLGVLGVVLIVQPWAGISFGLLLALTSGVLYGAFLTTNRMLAGRYSGMAMLAAQLLVGGVLLAPLGIVGASKLAEPAVMVAVAISATSSAVANLMLLMAYQMVEATRLAPLVYFQLVGATLYGMVLFGVFPAPIPAVGLALLFLSGFTALLIRPNSRQHLRVPTDRDRLS